MEDQVSEREKCQLLVDVARDPLPKSLKELELAANRLPLDQDFHFYSNFQQFKVPLNDLQNRVVSLMTQIGSVRDLRSASASSWPPDSDEAYEWLVSVQDDLLERVDASMDKFYADRKELFKQKAELPLYEPTSKLNHRGKTFDSAKASETSSRGDVKVARGKDNSANRCPVPFHIRTIPRPQDKFDFAVDNSNTPFKHPSQLQVNPPNLSAPSSVAISQNDVRTMEPDSSTGYAHPLEVELREMAYLKDLMEPVEVRRYDTLAKTPFQFISTLGALKEMADKLRLAGEIAVDLENHHYRSYQGFVCLMQLSTRHEDFVVDTLALRSHIGPCLGSIFSDSAIRKVMHGSDRDIVWLQRDFGIYVCNLFDTGQAARVLQLPSAGLAFLLEHFCDIHADKRYQLADWRIRPLPAEMLKYAREDTHYLLYVYDILRQQLCAVQAEAKTDGKNPCLEVYERSRDICLQLYSKECLTETSYLQIHGLHEKQLRPDQFAAVANLYAWRDKMARKEDESTGYVLPNHILFQLASEMPNTVRQLQSIVKGSHTLVGRNAGVIIDLIRLARENPVLAPLNTCLKHNTTDATLVGKISKDGEEFDDKVDGLEIQNMEHVNHDNDYLLSKDRPISEEEKTEVSNLLQGQIRTSLDSRASKEDGELEEVEPVQRDSLQHVNIGVSPITSTSDAGLGSAVVSRKMSSMFSDIKGRKTPAFPLPGGGISTSGDSIGSNLQTSPRSHLTAEPTASDEVGGGSTGGNIATFDNQRMPLDAEAQQSNPDQEVMLVDERHVSKDEGSMVKSAGASMQIPTSVYCEKQTRVSIAPVVQPQKSSGMGALLGSRKKSKSKALSQSTDEEEQVQGRMKAQTIESSLLLPFRATTQAEQCFHSGCAPNGTAVAEILFTKGEVKDVEVKFDVKVMDCELGNHVETPDRGEVENTTHLEGIIMSKTEAEEGGVARDDSNYMPGDEARHRKWWPRTEELSIASGLDRSAPAPAPVHLNEHSKDESNDMAVDGHTETDLPLSLSEAHRRSRKSKRKRNGPSNASAENDDVIAKDKLEDHMERKKRARKEEMREVFADGRTATGSFDYAEARQSLGFNYLYAQEAEPKQQKLRVVTKRERNTIRAPVKNTGFDSLRRVRQEPRPEGIPSAPRRQVYPPTGNRTAVFKK